MNRRALGGDVTAAYQTGVHNAYVGNLYSFGFGPFGARGSRPVRFTRVEVLGVPDGLDVVVRAVSRATSPGRLGSLVGDPVKRDPARFVFVPIDHVVLPPGTEPEPYYLVVTARPAKLGTFETTGLRVHYQAGNEKGSVDYGYRLLVEVTDVDGIDPRVDTPLTR